MSNTSNPLIDVEFQDTTNYATPAPTEDVVGMVLEGAWGECDRAVPVDPALFNVYFNPAGLGRVNYSFSCVQNCFAKGASTIEVIRLSKAERWLYFAISQQAASGGVTGNQIVITKSNEPYLNADQYAQKLDPTSGLGVIRFRYAGGFPGSVTITPYDSGSLDIGTAQLFSLELYDVAANLLESLVVSFDSSILTLQGESYFYADVINARSQYFRADPAVITAVDPLLTNLLAGSVTILPADVAPTLKSITPTGGGEAVVGTAYQAQDYINAYNRLENRDDSLATLLVSSYAPGIDVVLESDEPAQRVEDTEDVQSVQRAIMAVCDRRMDCNALLGLAPGVWAGVASQTWLEQRTTFVQYFNALNPEMFGGAIVAEERYQIGRQLFVQDGTAGWAGRICAVSAALRNRNNLPSYKEYGGYNGTLLRSLTFTQVVDLHNNYGIGSIYSSSVGNFIFNIQSLFGIRSSYFSKLNIMRMVAVVLSYGFDQVERFIHTYSAMDRSERIRLQGRLNTFIGNLAARGEVRNESSADVGDVINTDFSTSGGKILHVEFRMWFLGLTEAVKIRMIATDSSTTAEVS